MQCATRPFVLKIGILCLGASALLVSACSSREQNDSSKSALPAASASPSASVAPPQSGPNVRCLDLPKAARFELRASADSKTLYYVVRDIPNDAATADQDAASLSIHALDIATKADKKVAEDVLREFAVTNDGHVVFTRYEKDSTGGRSSRNIYSTAGANGETPKLINSFDHFMVDYYVDVVRSKIFYTHERDIYEVAAAGGEPKKIGSGQRAVNGNDAGMLLKAPAGEYQWLPHGGEKPKNISLPIGKWGRVLGISHGAIISSRSFRDGDPFYLTSLESAVDAEMVDAGTGAAKDAGAGKGAENELSFGAEVNAFKLLPSWGVVYASVKQGEDRGIYEIEAKDHKDIFHVKGLDISGFVPLGPNTFGVLACQDTYWNESCDGFDEVDVCIVERAPAASTIDIPIRNNPGFLEGIAKKLAPLLEENDLKGARTGFHHFIGEHARWVIESPAAGPTEIDALRARARAIQARVTELSGKPALDVHVGYANGYVAESRFEPKQKRFVTFVGMGIAVLPDLNEYPLEVDPKVVVGASTSTCTGSVKNTGQTPLENLEVLCSVGSPYDKKNAVGRGKTKPSTIAPGAEAQYTTTAFPYFSYSDPSVRVTVLRGEEEMLFMNRHATKAAMELFEAGAKSLPTTGLAYAKSTAVTGTYTLHVLMTDVFEKQAPEKRIESCTSLTKAFAKIAFPLAVLPKQVRIDIYDSITRQLKFSFDDGKLEAPTAKGQKRL
ncbi:MAG TPA: hypothetical protein PK156_20950 [Polyangium sp.]|nr:hypothetical protein [Polyangium sp.]